MITIKIKAFKDLSALEMYQVLHLRSEVFVVEQDCIYQDIDGKDEKALHVLGWKENSIIAYSRIFKPGDYFDMASIGRVVVKKSERKHGYGHEIMKTSIETIHRVFNETKIKISAQKYLKKFYRQHGFVKQGEEYLEDGIPHVCMVKSKKFNMD